MRPHPSLPQPALRAERLGSRARAWLAGLGWLLAACVLFLCYVRVSRTQPANSDSAANTLQAWDMLHGNLLLHGWWLSDVSFYPTELPEYMLIDRVRGLSPDVVHIAAALTYTLLIGLTALVAKGRATGKEAVVRVLIAAGIMLAPQPGAAVSTLLLAPDHVGSAVPVLLLFLLVDRAPPRWYVPVLAGVLLAWALVADELILTTGVIPLAAVCGWRAADGTIRRGEPLRSRWLELSLIGAAAAATVAARAILAWIPAHGGFVVAPLKNGLVTLSVLRQNLTAIPRGLLLLFGAGLPGHQPGFATAMAVLHLTGLALAAWALVTAVRWFRPGANLVDLLLATAVAINLIAAALLVEAAVTGSQREYVAVLPFAAALAGRVLGPRIAASAWLAPVLAAVLGGYALALTSAMIMPAAPVQGARLAAWLAGHHLDYGIASYWNADIVTLISGQRVHVVSWKYQNGALRAHRWEAQRSWYDPRRHNASFAVVNPRLPAQRHLAVTAFGPPSRVYRAGGFLVLVWHKNLLTGLSRPAGVPAGRHRR
jgi:hypothetical protein